MKLFKKTINFWAVVLVSALTLGACNQNPKASNQNQEHLDDLKKEMQDVSKEIEQLVTSESADFKNEAQRILEKFEHSVDKFEGRMKATGQEVDEKMQMAITNLQAEALQLDSTMQSFTEETQDEWLAFRDEAKYDLDNLGKSIGGFFKDSKPDHE